MPETLTDKILGGFSERQEKRGADFGKIIPDAMDFASRSVKLEFDQERLEEKREQVGQLKMGRDAKIFDRISSQLNTALKLPPKARKALIPSIQKTLASAGTELGPVAESLLLEGDPSIAKAITIMNNTLSTPEQKQQGLQSLQKALPADEFLDLAKQFVAQAGQTQRTEITTGAQKEIAKETQQQRAEEFKFNKTIKIADLKLDAQQLTFKINDAISNRRADSVDQAKKDKLKGFERAGDLRAELRKPFEQYASIRTTGKNMLDQIDKKGPFRDFAMVFDFIKLVDPGSVVRGDERRGFQITGSLGTKITNTLQNWVNGKTLNDTQRNEIRDFVTQRWENDMRGYLDASRTTFKAGKAEGLENFDPAQGAIVDDLKFLQAQRAKFKGTKLAGQDPREIIERIDPLRKDPRLSRPEAKKQLSNLEKLKQRLSAPEATTEQKNRLRRIEEAIKRQRGRQ